MSSDGIYRQSEVAGTGFGMVSSQTIAKGTLITSEKPLVAVPEHFNQLSILRQLQRLDREKRDSFFALKNTWTGLQPVEGIIKTNAIPLGKGSARGAIFLICSRFNHSCTANAAYHWNEDVGEERVFAVQNIKSGEEITVNYLRDELWYLPTDERKAEISKTYGFQCQCVRCSCVDQVDRKKSDERRVRMAKIDEIVGDGVAIVTNPSKALSSCREALTLLQEEGESEIRSEAVLYDAFQICVAHGDLARAELALEAKKVWQGGDAPGLEEMLR
ncbi:hypothetical protein LTR53_017653 [Teratosphaeriaceae sp. CCFEE 6253]|nr:hypothetical protein LTR53_017653 [Teratosphaeriaceae sp. CCFEE 6253]